ncbi:hypothetical protein [Rahnella phage Sarma103]|nr:hypothetical protein [Rahnella phage Sarma103]
MSTRNVKQIEADIAKLKAELADVKDSEAMRDSAVHILKNLGWTREKGGWVRPSKPNMAFIDFDDKPKAIKVGDFVRQDGYLHLYHLVRSIQGNSVVVSRILKKQHFGVVCEPASYSRPLMGLTKVTYDEINL